MKRLWLLCPVEAISKISILSNRLQIGSENLVAYIEKKQDAALKELEHEFYADK